MQPLFCHRPPAILSIAHVMSCPACRTTHVKVRCCWGLGGNVINSTWMKLAQVGRRCSWDSKEMCKCSWFSKSVFSHPLVPGYLADLTPERIICNPQKGPLWNVRYIIKTCVYIYIWDIYIYIHLYIYIYIHMYIYIYDLYSYTSMYLFNLTYLYYSILLVWVGLGGNTHTHTHWIKTCTPLTEFSTGHVDPSHLPKAHGPRSSMSPANQKHYLYIYVYTYCKH